MSKIVADLNESQEKTLKNLKRLGYILNREVNTKPDQISFGLDILDILLGQFSEQELIEIILKDNERA
jgi:hypothetical protein